MRSLDQIYMTSLCDETCGQFGCESLEKALIKHPGLRQLMTSSIAPVLPITKRPKPRKKLDCDSSHADRFPVTSRTEFPKR